MDSVALALGVTWQSGAGHGGAEGPGRAAAAKCFMMKDLGAFLSPLGRGEKITHTHRHSLHELYFPLIFFFGKMCLL